MLDDISTIWPMIEDPRQFVIRYAPAIEGYLMALVRDADKVEEIRQDFLLRVLEKGLVSENKLRGKFRHYLKVVVRNAAISYLRKKPVAHLSEEHLAQLADEAGPDPIEREWLEQWRRCMLDRVWEALELHERRAPDNHAYTVLRVYVEHHKSESSEEMAARVSERINKPMRADAFRKQLSRARRLFVQMLVEEVKRTLEDPTPENIADELSDVRLLADVMPYLPEGLGDRL